MVVHGTDSRRVINPENVEEFTKFPLKAVTAIDTIIAYSPTNFFADYGSGIVIAPNYVLTAAHNVYDDRANRNKVVGWANIEY